MWILLGLVLGFALGWVGASATALIYGDLAGVSQAEGAYAMGAIFFIGPAGGIAGAVTGLLLGLRQQRRRAARRRGTA